VGLGITYTYSSAVETALPVGTGHHGAITGAGFGVQFRSPQLLNLLLEDQHALSGGLHLLSCS
jgi:hypothetical protein